METIFTLPLAILATFLVLAGLLLIAPKALSLPFAQFISKLRKNTACQSVFGTICLLLLGLFISSFLEILRGADKVQRGDMRLDLMGTVDYLRAQVSCVLCLLNLMLVLLCPALAESSKQLDSQIKNLDAMKRQVKGLQTEYERVTTKPDGTSASAPVSTDDEWKRKVDKLIKEKADMQDQVDSAFKLKSGSEAKVEAMLQQIKGFDKEYDRVLEENRQLQRKLSQLDSSFKAPGVKKDE